MDKILRWYIDGNISRSKTQVGGIYRLKDGVDYRPEWVYINVRITGAGDTPMLIDINDDGTSIFDSAYRPALTEGLTEHSWSTIPAGIVIRDGSVMSLDIDQIFNEDTCRDLTVEMGLNRA